MDTASHFDEQTCWAYAIGALDERVAAELERHMAICDDCADQVGRMIGEAAEEQRWNAAAHGRAWRRERLRLRLTTLLQTARGAIRDALEGWLTEGGDESARVRAHREKGGLSWVLAAGQFGPAVTGGYPSPTRARGAVRTRGSVGPTRGRHQTTTELRLADGSIVILTIEEREIRVRFSGRLKGDPPPPVLISPEDERAAPNLVSAEWNDFQREWHGTAELPAGDFEVIFGPEANQA